MARPRKNLKLEHEERLDAAIDEINEIMDEIREYMPNANIFINGEGEVSLGVHSKPYGYSNAEQQKWRNSRIYTKVIHYADCGGF